MDGAFALLGQLAAIYLNTGNVPTRRAPEDLHPQIVPYGTFVDERRPLPERGGGQQQVLAGILRSPRAARVDPGSRFASNAKRIENRTELISLIAARFRENTRDVWIARLLERDVPAARSTPLMRSSRTVISTKPACWLKSNMRRPEPYRCPASRSVCRRTPGAVRLAPPTLGEHNAAVLDESAGHARCGRAIKDSFPGVTRPESTEKRLIMKSILTSLLRRCSACLGCRGPGARLSVKTDPHRRALPARWRSRRWCSNARHKDDGAAGLAVRHGQPAGRQWIHRCHQCRQVAARRLLALHGARR